MECYLCGTENPPEADFCSRCAGQLLKIGSEPEHEPADSADVEFALDEEVVETETAPPARSRLPSIRSAEHRRLHDALGLGTGSDNHEDDGGASVPKVATASVPMIGTRAGAFNETHAHQQGTSRRAVVAITILAALVGILGYRTLTGTDDTQPPPEVAFVDSTTLPPPVDTTPTLRPWTQNEVIGKFGPTFVTVILYDCPSEERFVTSGVALDPTNVLFSRAGAPSADAVVVVSNLGNRAIARLNAHDSGATVATTWRSLSRTLDLTDVPAGEESFLISRDIASETTAVGSSENDTDPASSTDPTGADDDAPSEPATISIAATSQGDAMAVTVAGDRYELDTLRDMTRYRAELAPDAKGDPAKPCDAAQQILPATSVEAPEPDSPGQGEITVAET